MDPEALELLGSVLTSLHAQDGIPEGLHNRLLRMGAVTALEQVNDRQAAEVLALAVQHCPDPDIQPLALNALGRGSAANPAAAAELYRLAIFAALQPAADVIRHWEVCPPDSKVGTVFNFLYSDQPLQPTRDVDANTPDNGYAQIVDFFLGADIEVRQRLLNAARRRGLVHWSALLPALAEGNKTAFDKILQRFTAMTVDDRHLTVNQLAGLASAGSQAARDALCELCIQFEHQPACSLANQYGYTPSDSIRRALFFFLQGNWPAYEAADFSHTLLPAAYESASAPVRQRILARSRASGHIEWLSRSRPLLSLHDLSERDWDSVIQHLVSNRRWSDLQRLAASAPPIYCARILAEGNEVGSDLPPEDHGDWDRLSLLARQAVDHLPALHYLRSLQVEDPVTAVATSPDERWLALTGPEPHIRLLHLPEGRTIPTLSGPVARSQAVDFSPDSQNLICSGAGHALRIFRLDDGQLVKTLTGHTAPVRSISVHPASRAAFSAAFDGTARAWRFPHGPEINRLAVGAEVFGLALSDGGNTVAVAAADGSLTAWRWEEEGNIRRLVENGPAMTAVAGIPGEVMVAAYNRSQQLGFWNTASGRQLQAVDLPGSPLTALTGLPNLSLFAAGFYDGSIRFVSALSGQIIESQPLFDSALTGICYLPAARLMVSTDGRGIRLDSLSGILIVRSPQSQLTEQQIELARPALPGAWRDFLFSLLRWRTRFDIQVTDPGVMPVGEFDIQL